MEDKREELDLIARLVGQRDAARIERDAAIHRAEKAEAERDELKAQVAVLRGVINDVLPIAKGLSCEFDSEPDPTFHCCDWSEWVRRALHVLSISDNKLRRQPR